MADIHSLKKSITELSHGEAFKMLQEARRIRRDSLSRKTRRYESRRGTKKAQNRKKKVQKNIAKLSKKEIEQLIKMLEEE